MTPLKLIVGLGNPGRDHAATRHNLGAVLVREWAERAGIVLKPSVRFQAEVGRGALGGQPTSLLIPGTWMNLSGRVVGAFARYFRIAPEEILIAFDEVAFEPGVVRLRSGGGDNGHNGVASVIEGLGSRAFQRLRIGVGHPGDKQRMISWLTGEKMPDAERQLASAAWQLTDELLGMLLRGHWQPVMNHLHAPTTSA